MAIVVPLLVPGIAPAASRGGNDGPPAARDLRHIRSRILQLNATLRRLDRKTLDARAREERLTAQLQLAKTRVLELEAVLRLSQKQIMTLRQELGTIAHKLERRREAVRVNLQMAALLGRPGPLRLFYDAARGGDLGRAIGTVAVLTKGQVRLMQEYSELERQHNEKLGELSLALTRAQGEAAGLESRRQELARVRDRVRRERASLEHRRKAAAVRLADLQNREAALERLLNLLASRRRLTGQQDMRRYQGALPWPVDGTVVESFGRHQLATYASYTVCNGIRLRVPGQRPVKAIFPGVVAYARYFNGYGNMAVIDHGAGVYSLVAGLATILVRRNQNVSMGTTLGLSSPPKKGGNVYLEIRVDGKAVNPRRWLRLKGGGS
ncbi:MAG: peptidoglycan DD-metalloendopeptidase family protein [Acidobacteria bacterium]|nr:peptidoglycan DD-metalloendopeptidase family protein [Acidobacteriota bacterium]